MSQRVFHEYVDHELRLPWQITCRLAVLALCEGVDFNSIVARAIAEYLKSRS